MTTPFDPFPTLDVPRKLEMTEAERLGLMLRLLDESSEPTKILTVLHYWAVRHDA